MQQSGGRSAGSARDSETRDQHRANSLFVTSSRVNLSMTRSTKIDRTDSAALRKSVSVPTSQKHNFALSQQSWSPITSNVVPSNSRHRSGSTNTRLPDRGLRRPLARHRASVRRHRKGRGHPRWDSSRLPYVVIRSSVPARQAVRARADTVAAGDSRHNPRRVRASRLRSRGSAGCGNR